LITACSHKKHKGTNNNSLCVCASLCLKIPGVEGVALAEVAGFVTSLEPAQALF
jgi:hypothetical protein